MHCIPVANPLVVSKIYNRKRQTIKAISYLNGKFGVDEWWRDPYDANSNFFQWLEKKNLLKEYFIELKKLK